MPRISGAVARPTGSKPPQVVDRDVWKHRNLGRKARQDHLGLSRHILDHYAKRGQRTSRKGGFSLECCDLSQLFNVEWLSTPAHSMRYPVTELVMVSTSEFARMGV